MAVHFPSGGRLPSASPVLVVGAVMVVLSPATRNSIRVTVSNPELRLVTGMTRSSRPLTICFADKTVADSR